MAIVKHDDSSFEIAEKEKRKERKFVMKRTKKILVTLLCAVLLVTGTVAVTVAYLTASTEVVKNTFTVGSVAITLDEVQVDPYGTPSTKTGEGENITWTPAADAPRIKENKYKLIPGHEYTKDPTVHVTKGSEQCWLFVKVENGLASIEADVEADATNGIEAIDDIADQMAANGWSLVSGTTNVYSYEAIVDARTAAVDKVVFSEFTLKGDADVANYASANITIDAYAVQADGFDTAAEAWAAAPATWGN